MMVQEAGAVPACGLPAGYRKVADLSQDGKPVTAWLSREADDPAWDRFLEHTPLGQFQQSTLWAKAKAPEGWQPLRVVILAEDAIVAGFQIMARPAWRGRGRIGYISKGPVVLPGRPWAVPYTASLLQQVVRQERLSALVVQPPDLCHQMPAALEACGFLPDLLMKVNDTTWVIDLDRDFAAVEASMSRTTRNLVRRAAKTGVTIRQGGRDDLARFFELMLATCQRQETQPNPSELGHLEALWDGASPSGHIRLFLAEHEGRIVAGLLAIVFGATATLWKVGAAPPDKELKPNDSMYHHAIRWAHENGCRHCDFAAFDRRMALSIIAGEPLSEEHLRSRFLFLTRFGGRPLLLPGAQIYFPNSLARVLYRTRYRRRLSQAARQTERDGNRVEPTGNERRPQPIPLLGKDDVSSNTGDKSSANYPPAPIPAVTQFALPARDRNRTHGGGISFLRFSSVSRIARRAGKPYRWLSVLPAALNSSARGFASCFQPAGVPRNLQGDVSAYPLRTGRSGVLRCPLGNSTVSQKSTQDGYCIHTRDR
jgi:peptidoglycan pentaglycine glycine transferase (the first glycine)